MMNHDDHPNIASMLKDHYMLIILIVKK